MASQSDIQGPKADKSATPKKSNNHTPTIFKFISLDPATEEHKMVKAVKGVLVTCDPSIKAIILKIDQEKHDYIVEDLDDTHVMVKESMLQTLKARLDEELKNTQQIPDEDESE